MDRRTRFPLAVLLIPGVLAALAYAFTAANAVPATNVGQGAGPVTGYSFSAGPTYTLDSNNPQLITTVQFTLNGSSSEARVVRSRVAPSGAFQTCALTASTATTSSWACSAANASATTATSLNVAASQ